MTNFGEWVRRMVNQYEEDDSILIRLFGSKTYVAYNFKTQKTSIARCHPKDVFVEEIGRAIAYARCKGYEIPKVEVYKKLSEMKNGEKFITSSGDTYRYIARDDYKGVFVVYNESRKYGGMAFDLKYKMVE